VPPSALGEQSRWFSKNSDPSTKVLFRIAGDGSQMPQRLGRRWQERSIRRHPQSLPMCSCECLDPSAKETGKRVAALPRPLLLRSILIAREGGTPIALPQVILNTFRRALYSARAGPRSCTASACWGHCRTQPCTTGTRMGIGHLTLVRCRCRS